MTGQGCACSTPLLARDATLDVPGADADVIPPSDLRCGNGIVEFQSRIQLPSRQEELLLAEENTPPLSCACSRCLGVAGRHCSTGCGGTSANGGTTESGLLLPHHAGRWPDPGALSATRTPGVIESHQDRSRGVEVMEGLMAAWRRRQAEPGFRFPRESRSSASEAPAAEQPPRRLTPSVILWPGPLGEVRQDIPPTAALLDAVRTAVSRRKAGTCCGWIVEPFTEANGWLVPNPDEPGHIAGPSSHENSLLPGAGSPAFDITYRSESFHFNSGLWMNTWLAEYLGASTGLDLVSSPNDVMAALWEPLLTQFDKVDSGTGAFGNVLNTLGCYALPTTTMAAEMDYLFFYASYGAPYYLWITSAAMVYAYADEATDQTTSASCGGASCCTGYTAFLRNVIAGGTDTVSSYSTSRDVTGCMNFHFVGAGGAGTATACTSSMPWRDCTEYMKDCAGAGWNDWFIALPAGSSFSDILAPGNYIYDPTTHNPADAADCGADNFEPTGPGTGCGTNWYGENWHVSYGAAPLAFDGYTMDVIMFLAGLVYDYTRTRISPLNPPSGGLGPRLQLNPNPDYVEGMRSARRLAGYALRIAAQWGYHTIHEVGHTYNGDNHCTTWACCSELAAQRWLCKTEGLLGLPFCEYYTKAADGSGDWDSATYAGTAGNCMDLCATCETGQPAFTCTVIDPGERNASADVTFSVGSCAAPSTEVVWP